MTHTTAVRLMTSAAVLQCYIAMLQGTPCSRQPAISPCWHHNLIISQSLVRLLRFSVSAALQGNRITQGISCADVADVCVKSLHDPAARNKAFEVCYEYTPESGLEMYELVAHLPDKSNNYLGPALSTLQKNT